MMFRGHSISVLSALFLLGACGASVEPSVHNDGDPNDVGASTSDASTSDASANGASATDASATDASGEDGGPLPPNQNDAGTLDAADAASPVVHGPSLGPTLAVGGLHTCTVLDDNSVKCWGSNNDGQLGLGDTKDRGDSSGEMGDALPTIDLGTGRTARAITAGSAHACALLDNHSVKCWGRNDYGQLGLGDTKDRGDSSGEMGDALPTIDLGTGRIALAVVAGSTHTCAVLDNHTVKCWGRNDHGQLGLGDTKDRGDASGEMGDALPTIDLGTGRTALAVAAGSSHTCVLLDDHSIKCWGMNEAGRLGLGDTKDRGVAANEMGDNLPVINLGSNRSAIAVVAGIGPASWDLGAHTCALLDDHSVKCWGGNLGQLGLGNTNYYGGHPNEMGDNLPAIDLGSGRTALAISAGSGITCAQLDNHAAKCWGINGDGRLGLGDVKTRGAVPKQMGNDLPAIDLGSGRSALAIFTSRNHTCAVLDDRSLKCWGDNTYGQLGLGDTIARGRSAAGIGNSLETIDVGTGRSILTPP